MDASAARPIDNGEPTLRDYSAEADVLLIVFSGLKRNPEKLPGFSFRAVTEGMPMKKLFLRDVRKAWFLDGLPGVSKGVEDTAEFLREEARGFRRIVLTGYSLGGFAAHLYGAMLGQTEVVTFSPQTFVGFWQRLWHKDHRWQRYALKLMWRSNPRFRDVHRVLRKFSGARHTIHYAADSPLDAVHAKRLAGIPQVRIVQHHEGRHRLVTALRDSGELRRILEGAAFGEARS